MRRGRPFPTCETNWAIAPFRLLPTTMCTWSHAGMSTLSTDSIRKQVRNRTQPPRNLHANRMQEALHPPRGQPIERKAWCERGDSNPHPLRDQILSLARLPIPPLSRFEAAIIAYRLSHFNPRGFSSPSDRGNSRAAVLVANRRAPTGVPSSSQSHGTTACTLTPSARCLSVESITRFIPGEHECRVSRNPVAF